MEGFGADFCLRVKKISSRWVKKYPDQRRVSLLFTAGQKHAWVGLRPNSSQNNLLVTCMLCELRLANEHHLQIFKILLYNIYL